MKINTKIEVPKINYNISDTSDDNQLISLSNQSNAEVETFSLTANQENDSAYENTQVNLVNNDWIYDPKNNNIGLFGGNQGNLISNIESYIDNEKIRQIVSKYYPDYTEEDLELLFYRMNTVGCGYIAAINTIFYEYIFHNENDFYERFGFPPYKMIFDNGAQKLFNYDYLFLDFFLYYAKFEKGFETIEEVYGNAAEEIEYRNGIIEDSALSNSDFSRTGMTGTNLDDVGKVMERYLREKGIEFSCPLDELSPGTEEWEKLKEELNINVQDDQVLYSQSCDADHIKSILQEGKQVIISSYDFTLYYPTDIDGNGQLDDVYVENVGAHAMAVVSTTNDGKLVVSSWGREYLLDPKENQNIKKIIYDYGTPA